MKSNYIDLSHTIKHGEVTYKGLPAPIICDYLSREESKSHYDGDTSFLIGKIEMVSNTGTYIDCPFHRYENGKDLSEVPLGKFVDLEGILISVPYQEVKSIDQTYFKGFSLEKKAVLVHTDWSELWQTEDYYSNHPYLTEDAALYLRDQGVVLVGIDAYNIDDTSTRQRPVHSILLKEEILIVEHMNNLGQLVGRPFTFSAIPPKIESVGTFPVRAFAKVT